MTVSEIDDAIARWQAATSRLVAVFRGFDDDALDRPSACGDWTNRQLMAHIATGYAVRRGWLEAAVHGGPMPRRSSGDDANARAVTELSLAGRDALVDALERERGEIESLLRQLRPDALDLVVPRTAGPMSLRETLAGFSDHDLEHADELRPSPRSL